MFITEDVGGAGLVYWGVFHEFADLETALQKRFQDAVDGWVVRIDFTLHCWRLNF